MCECCIAWRWSMKKITAVFVLFTLIFCFASCGKSKQYKKIGEVYITDPQTTEETVATQPTENEFTEGLSEAEDYEDENITDSSTSTTRRQQSVPVSQPNTPRPVTSVAEPSNTEDASSEETESSSSTEEHSETPESSETQPQEAPSDE